MDTGLVIHHWREVAPFIASGWGHSFSRSGPGFKAKQA